MKETNIFIHASEHSFLLSFSETLIKLCERKEI